MTNQNFEDSESPSSGEHTPRNKKMGEAASEAFSKASDTARDAGEKAKRAAADAASSMSDHVMGFLNDQLGVGAQSANRFASSMMLAADDLEQENRMLAGLVRGFAHNVDHYADRVEDQTVEQLAKSASDLTRRQPALMFGLAALAGFFAFRTFKSASANSVASPPIQPMHYHSAGDNHG
jgi:hypothetical protein